MTDLRAIGWPYPDAASGDEGVHAGDPAWAQLLAQHAQAQPARVVEQHRSGYLVAQAPGEAVSVESPPEWQRAAGYRKGLVAAEDRAAVGDWVLVERGKIVALLPRHSAIKRGAAGEHYKQQVIAANIDTVFVVCGLDADFNPRRIERYLLLVQGSGAGAVVVLTKADKATAADPAAVAAALEAVSGSLAQEMMAFAVNAKDPATVDVLAPWLQPGSSVVLVGSSGAGKSTLTNTLLGSEKMKTAEVRESDERGRHTTTHRALVPLPSGACLIDTPGMRELKPTGEEVVEQNFTDIETLAGQCRFRDCRHEREPGCAVRAAIEARILDPARYANFLKLRDEVAGAADRLATRIAQKSDAKVANKALNKRLDDKYGKH